MRTLGASENEVYLRQTMTNLHGIPIKSSSFGVGRSFSNLFNWWYPGMTSPAGIGGTSGTPQWGKTVGGAMGRKLGFGMWLPISKYLKNISKYLKISQKHVVNTKKTLDDWMIGWCWGLIRSDHGIPWLISPMCRTLQTLTGTARYASINAHKGPWLVEHGKGMLVAAGLAMVCGYRSLSSEMMTPKDEYWVEAINHNLVRKQRFTLQLA